jgi:cytochrome c oxidase cbb3-type subunit 3
MLGESTGRTRYWVLSSAAVIAVVLIAAIAVSARLHRERLAHRLLADLPDAAGLDPQLMRFAASEARPIYREHCAVCHGADMRGNPAIGAPALDSPVWLWGDGSVYDIERIILYGVRAGVSKTDDVDDMPAFGLKGTFHYQYVPGFRGKIVGGAALDSGQVWSLVQYLLKLNHRPYQAEAANEGEQLSYESNTSCRDCHGPDLAGVVDYGAPNLTIDVWNNGGTPQDIYNSIYYGRHRMMPAWRGVLTLGQIRALAVYIHSASRQVPPAVSETAAVSAPTVTEER